MGARNERRLCALYCGKSSGFEIIHGLLDRVMQLLGVKWTKNRTGYYITADEGLFFQEALLPYLFFQDLQEEKDLRKLSGQILL